MEYCRLCQSYLGALILCQQALEQCAPKEILRPQKYLRGAVRILQHLQRHITRGRCPLPVDNAVLQTLKGLEQAVAAEAAIARLEQTPLPGGLTADNSVDRFLAICALH